MTVPWNEGDATDRIPPRECVGNARDALNKAWGGDAKAAIPLMLEALDWLRRGFEQMAEPQGAPTLTGGLIHQSTTRQMGVDAPDFGKPLGEGGTAT